MPEKFNELLLKPDIIELYNSGITPDYGYLMNGRFEKDMIKTLYPLKTLSGNPITWEASDTEYLFPSISLAPKQAGTGDPSPENVRPISGYDSVKVNVRGKNLLSDENFQSSEANGITFTKMGNGVVHIEGTSTALADSTVVRDVPQLPPGKYIGVFSPYLIVVVKKASTGQNIWYNVKNYVTIEPGDVIQYYYLTVQPGETLNKDVYIFLAAGETPYQASDFEPYQPGTTATLTLPETIYGGTVDAVTGVGENTRKIFILKIADMDYSEDYPGWRNVEGLDQCIKLNYDGVIKGAISNISTIIRAHTKTSLKLYFDPHDLGGLNQSQMKELYPNLVVQVALPLLNPEPFQATGNQALTIQPGKHTIYTDGDNITLSRKARRLEV